MTDDNTTEETTAVTTADDTEDELSTAVESSTEDTGDTDEELTVGQPGDDPETFPREYVEQLRQQSARYRQRAQEADDLAYRLHVELVRATGRLADPTDLPFNPEHLADAGNMAAAIDELLERKPHLASRRPTGDVGQGPTPSAGSVDLAAILRGRAG